jgi:hypothetical protein
VEGETVKWSVSVDVTYFYPGRDVTRFVRVEVEAATESDAEDAAQEKVARRSPRADAIVAIDATPA